MRQPRAVAIRHSRAVFINGVQSATDSVGIESFRKTRVGLLSYCSRPVRAQRNACRASYCVGRDAMKLLSNDDAGGRISK
jgi:hypothetical protein